MKETNKLKPMSFFKSILFFGIPTLFFFLCIYVVLPYFGKNGVKPILNYSITLLGPVIVLFIASLIALSLDGYKLNWNTLKNRFRLKRMNKKDWIWALGLFLFMVTCNGLLLFTQKWLLKFPLFSPPDFLPSTVDPRVTVSGIPPEFSNTPIWMLTMFQLFFFFFNIVGEEFWWRGYIFPRQELAFGNKTWIIHGILWTLFHSFWKWNLLVLLPGAMAVAYVAQKRKNTTLLIAVHLAANTIGSTILLLFR